MLQKLLFILLILSSTTLVAQEIPEGAIMLNENTVIKDETGKKIDLSEAMKLTQTGEWKILPVNDSEGKMQYFQLKKTTDNDKKVMSQKPIKGMDSNLIGKSAPNYTMVDLNGNTISSENTKGKVVVLNFWFAACKPCIDEIPELNEVYKKYKKNPNVIFASITFEKLKKVNSFLEKYPLKYPVVADAKEVCDIFKITGYPTNIIIDKEGNYSDYITGGNSKIGQLLSNSIQDALVGTKRTSSNNIMIDRNATFKLENGDIVPFKKVTEMLVSNKYQMVKQKDIDNNEYYLIKEK